MALYIIADLHLSLDENVDKPMDIYGGPWVNHTEVLKKEWEATIKPEDTVIIAGDISWGLKIEETMADLDYIAKLPGNKIIFKGNHDLWWTGINKLNKLYDNIVFVHNTFVAVGNTAVCGTRGWNCPGSEDFSLQDEKIYKREVLRLKTSIDLAIEEGYEDIVGVLHYPPTNDKKQASEFTRTFESYGIKDVYFGHLHGENARRTNNNYIYNGVSYKLISLDKLECKPMQIR